MEAIKCLKEERIIMQIIGDLEYKSESKLGINIWARKQPRDFFRKYAFVCKQISKQQLTVFVDDECSKYFCDYSDKQQECVNELCINFFKDLNPNYVFSSSFYDNGNIDIIKNIIRLGQYININNFIDFLPKEKREDIKTLNMDEIMHVFMQLSFMELFSNYIDFLVIGKQSINIAYLYRKIFNDKLGFIIIDYKNIHEV